MLPLAGKDRDRHLRALSLLWLDLLEKIVVQVVVVVVAVVGAFENAKFCIQIEIN